MGGGGGGGLGGSHKGRAADSNLIFPQPNFGSRFFWVGGSQSHKDPPAPFDKACYPEGKSDAGTLFFEIFGPEGRQAFSRPPAFAHALAKAKGGGQLFGPAAPGVRQNLALLP